MEGYQKTIAYLDYLENGMKMRNAGFVRVEGNAGQMRLEMKVKNVPDHLAGQYEVKADTGGTIGRIPLSRGTGSCSIIWKTDTADLGGKKLIQANGIYIRLPGRRLLQASWPFQMEFLAEEEEAVLHEASEASERERIQEEKIHPFMAPELQIYRESDENVHEDGEAEPKLDMKAAETEKETTLPDEVPEMTAFGNERNTEGFGDAKMPAGTNETESEEKANEKEQEEEPVCYGDKWEQLSHMYAQIHPFADEREYLSIEPKDFVVLRQEYQKMVHNSFLLHGYYNYRHLILGKIKEKDGWRYYLGVPGNFYNREKMVAEMFGFEAFEGERNPAKAGDFGYFMKRVEI